MRIRSALTALGAVLSLPIVSAGQSVVVRHLDDNGNQIGSDVMQPSDTPFAVDVTGWGDDLSLTHVLHIYHQGAPTDPDHSIGAITIQGVTEIGTLPAAG